MRNVKEMAVAIGFGLLIGLIVEASAWTAKTYVPGSAQAEEMAKARWRATGKF